MLPTSRSRSPAATAREQRCREQAVVIQEAVIQEAVIQEAVGADVPVQELDAAQGAVPAIPATGEAAPLKPIGPARLRALRDAIRDGTYPSDDDVLGGLERMLGVRTESERDA